MPAIASAERYLVLYPGSHWSGGKIFFKVRVFQVNIIFNFPRNDYFGKIKLKLNKIY
jgi:hypothetical protein